MKRDVFRSGTKMQFRYGPESAGDTPEHFSPDMPRGLRLKSRGFDRRTHGEERYPSTQDGVEKFHGAKAHLDRTAPPFEFGVYVHPVRHANRRK